MFFSELGYMKTHQYSHHAESLANLTNTFIKYAGAGDIPPQHRDMFEYFEEHYKNSNKGIKGRGTDRITNTRSNTDTQAPTRADQAEKDLIFQTPSTTSAILNSAPPSIQKAPGSSKVLYTSNAKAFMELKGNRINLSLRNVPLLFTDKDKNDAASQYALSHRSGESVQKPIEKPYHNEDIQGAEPFSQHTLATVNPPLSPPQQPQQLQRNAPTQASGSLDDWTALATHMKSKMAVMVENYFYARQKDHDKAEWEALVRGANAKRLRGAKGPNPPEIPLGVQTRQQNRPSTSAPSPLTSGHVENSRDFRFNSPPECDLSRTYYIPEANSIYKIEYPLDSIESVSFRTPPNGPNDLAICVIELSRPPKFFLSKLSKQWRAGGFEVCDDFTEDMQASRVLTHILGGMAGTLLPEVMSLLSTECFIRRHKVNKAIDEQESFICKDEICTDSGYASMRNDRDVAYTFGQDSVSLLERPRTNSNQDVDNTDETKASEESIGWVCDDIYQNIRQAVDPKSYALLSNKLPSLLKAFAVQFDAEITDNSSLQIMHFVYKHHRKAYKWLLSSLNKQSSAYWAAFHPNIMVNDIRDKILQKLPTGTISRQRPPRTFQVQFLIAWDPIQRRFREEQYKARANLGPLVLADLITLTGSPEDELQAATVGEYFRQTWPEGEIDLLGSIQALLSQNSYEPSRSTNAANLDGHFCLDGPHLSVTISGPAYLIAEYGEQLAWLASAIQPLSRDLVVYEPRLREIGNLEFEIDPIPNNVISSLLWTAPLQLFTGQIAHYGLVRGFPMMRRPKAFLGLEVSWHILLALTHNPTSSFPTNRQSGRYLLLGQCTTLELVDLVDDSPTPLEAEKWFIIWDIVFPGIPRPSSPYLDGQLTEDCALFQEHALNMGPAIVAKVIEASGIFSLTELTDDVRREILQRAVSAGINDIISAWSQRPKQASKATSKAPLVSRDYCESDNTTLAHSLPDSGVMISSRHFDISSEQSSQRQKHVDDLTTAAGEPTHIGQAEDSLPQYNLLDPTFTVPEWQDGLFPDASSLFASADNNEGIDLGLESFDFFQSE
ncbi:Pyriculol/pyriculariol biosynthesis cluster transcription factor [Paramyrothecium foliicola]|nr:Pyriculol/pyriculariol biosynthesis cluster transcription factor [Paramyrothecium foliicola]